MAFFNGGILYKALVAPINCFITIELSKVCVIYVLEIINFGPCHNARSRFSQLEREKLAAAGKDAVRQEREVGDDDTVATNSIDPFSSSSCESLPNSLSDMCPPHLSLDQQPSVAMATATPDAAEDQALDASLRWASLQAALEAFKARHPTLPLFETPDWAQGKSFCNFMFSTSKLLRYKCFRVSKKV